MLHLWKNFKIYGSYQLGITLLSYTCMATFSVKCIIHHLKQIHENYHRFISITVWLNPKQNEMLKIYAYFENVSEDKKNNW